MIDIPRNLAREFRAVLRRSLVDRLPAGGWPLLFCRTDRAGLILQAVQGDIGLRYRRPGALPPGVIAFRSSVLAEFEGKGEDPVTLEASGPGRGSARWTHGGEARVLEFDTVTPESVPAFPGLPKRLATVPEGFLRALGEAGQTAATDAVRFALNCVQLRGQAGQVVGTDGRQLLVRGGFPLPWPDDLLVPRLPVLACKDFAPEGPAGLGRTRRHIILAAGPWTFALAIDTKGRFPNIETVIPNSEAATGRLQIDPEDAALLAAALPKLPGRQESNAPVTLDLGQQVAVRARGDGPDPPAEVILRHSAASGTPVRLNLDRRHLLRALKLGFTEMQVSGADKPVAFRRGECTYLVMPLEPSAAASNTDNLRIPSPREAPPEPSQPPERRETPMPAPSTNGQLAEDPRPQDTRERGGLIDLFAEADALRGLLADALARSARVLAALRQHRRQAHAVQAAMASLRKLHIDP